ncbi:hypothetical protein WV31_12845 [Magnetospirillum sp. ME-1]|nr:hypothetical protein WV31_12845 [Magnetospirillum sp. ME-1]
MLAALLPPLLLFVNRGTVVPLVILALLGLAGRFVMGRFDISMGRGLAAGLVLMLGWGAASALWEETSGLAVPKAAQLAGLIVAGLLAQSSARHLSDRSVRRVLGILLGSILAGTAMVVFEWQAGCPISRAVFILRHGSAVGVTVHHYKTALTLFAVLLPLTQLAEPGKWRRLGLMAAVVLLVVAAKATNSNSTLVGLLMGGSAFAILRLAPRLGRIVLAAAFAGLIMLMPAIVSHLPQPKEAVQAFHALPNSGVHRLLIWHFTNDHVAERPWRGWGLDGARELPGGNGAGIIYQYDAEHDRLLSYPQQLLPLHPHNGPLQIWLEIGGIGAALVAACLVGLMWSAIRSVEPTVGALRGAAMTTALSVSLVSFGVWQSWWLAVLLIACALAGMPLAAGGRRVP